MPYPNRSTSPAKPGDKPRKARRPQSAQSYMLWLLSRQDYSAASLRTKLLSKEFPTDEVDAAIAFAQAHKFQSDERYAQSRAMSKSSRHGNWRVKQGLMQKGIDEDLAVEQLEGLAPEEERIIPVVRKFEGKKLTPELKQKIYRFLATRGFSSKPIKAAFGYLAAKQAEAAESSEAEEAA